MSVGRDDRMKARLGRRGILVARVGLRVERATRNQAAATRMFVSSSGQTQVLLHGGKRVHRGLPIHPLAVRGIDVENRGGNGRHLPTVADVLCAFEDALGQRLRQMSVSSSHLMRFRTS